jgi:hypothetical protein
MDEEADVATAVIRQAATRRNITAQGNALGNGPAELVKPCKGEISRLDADRTA